VTSLDLVPETFEVKIRKRYERYEEIKKAEVRFESLSCGYDDIGAGKAACSAEDADLVMVAYGTSARVCLGARKLAEKEGIKLGLFRPITLWPFPYAELGRVAKNGKPLLCVEMSMGQMVEDVNFPCSVRAGALLRQGRRHDTDGRGSVRRSEKDFREISGDEETIRTSRKPREGADQILRRLRTRRHPPDHH
jgi:pyruvate/2-oxoacid:ferredoxin oxidoreductase alpha subunit